jgi:hypothetical protein
MRRIGLLLLTSESEEILCDSGTQMKSESGTNTLFDTDPATHLKNTRCSLLATAAAACRTARRTQRCPHNEATRGLENVERP